MFNQARTAVTLLAFHATLCWSQAAFAQSTLPKPPFKPIPSLDELRQQVNQDEGSGRAGKSLSAYFQSRSSAELSALANDESLTIAMYAMWQELLRRDGPLLPAARPAYFLGFAQARLGVAPPQQWSIALSRSFASRWRDGKTAAPNAVDPLGSFAGDRAPEPLHKISWGNRELWAPSTMNVLTEGGEMVFHAQEQSLRAKDVRLSQLLDGPSPPDRMALLPTPGRWLVFFYHSDGSPSQLFCLESKSGKILWTAATWGRGRVRVEALSGKHHHLVEMSISTRMACLFGYGRTVCYLETFDMTTGKTVGRFAPNEWRWRESVLTAPDDAEER